MGLFGHLGSGNIGNDASLEAMVQYLSTHQPGAILDAMCSAPETVKDRYRLQSTPLRWRPPRRAPGLRRGKVLRGSWAKTVDTIRIASWVHRHEVVIVPGMGVLETTLPVRPWQALYDMFVLCASGRIFRTKVALVGVGANVAEERLTRWLFTVGGPAGVLPLLPRRPIPRCDAATGSRHQPGPRVSRPRVRPALAAAGLATRRPSASA